jgi:hypothetical protein
VDPFSSESISFNGARSIRGSLANSPRKSKWAALNDISVLAKELLDDKDIELAQRLDYLLSDNRRDAASLVEEIIPVYWKGAETLEPDPIYRPLYYIHMECDSRHFKQNTRHFIALLGAHLEGCLLWLFSNPPRFSSFPKPFGRLVVELTKARVLPNDLAVQLGRFNRVANVPAKHFGASPRQSRRLDERRFSMMDATLSFVIMRRLSIRLFEMIRNRGVSLPTGWKNFDEKWLTWDRKIWEVRK